MVIMNVLDDSKLATNFHTSMKGAYTYLTYKIFAALKFQDLFFRSSEVSFNLYSILINDIQLVEFENCYMLSFSN